MMQDFALPLRGYGTQAERGIPRLPLLMRNIRHS